MRIRVKDVLDPLAPIAPMSGTHCRALDCGSLLCRFPRDSLPARRSLGEGWAVSGRGLAGIARQDANAVRSAAGCWTESYSRL